MTEEELMSFSKDRKKLKYLPIIFAGATVLSMKIFGKTNKEALIWGAFSFVAGFAASKYFLKKIEQKQIERSIFTK